MLVMLTYFNDVKTRDFTGREINLHWLIQVKDFKLSSFRYIVVAISLMLQIY